MLVDHKIAQKVSGILESEIRKGVPENHRTQVYFTEKKKFAVLLVHGLYNSPQDMLDLARHFVELGANVFNARLDGHYESDDEILRSEVSWQTWLEQSRAHLAIARELGEKLILVGHSTGALALTWLAVENPKDIAALVWFAPAFRVQSGARMGTALLKFLNLNIKTLEGRTIAGHAGLEVDKMAKAFKSITNRAAEQLRRIPIWMANTQADLVIDPGTARKVFDSLPGSKRHSYLQPLTEFVSHDSIALAKNQNFKKLLNSLDHFLGLGAPPA